MKAKQYSLIKIIEMNKEMKQRDRREAENTPKTPKTEDAPTTTHSKTTTTCKAVCINCSNRPLARRTLETALPQSYTVTQNLIKQTPQHATKNANKKR